MSRANPLTILVLAAFATAALSGCTSAPLTQEQAEVRTETAMASFSAAMAGQEDGDILRMKGSMEAVEQPPGSGGGDEFNSMFEDIRIDLDLKWGTAGVVHATMSAVTGGATMTIESWCTPQRQVIKWGNDVYESRPSDREDSNALCNAFDGDELESGMDFLSGSDLSDMGDVDVVANDDGTITATIQNPEGNETMIVTIDKKGRVSRIASDGDEFTGAFDITYGSRSSIPVPAATGRIPAKVETEDDYDWENDYSEHTVRESPELPPLVEFEARWVEQDFERDETTVIYSFPLSTSGKQTQKDVSFQYHDEDGDGHISVGDRYEIWEAPADFSGESEYEGYLEMVIWDLWADGELNDMPLPGPGFALVTGALLLLGVALRRRT